ncbi:hypothetical protein CEXT_768551 [Caerostris extrusa]|uniref:Uncharacterized protein n=1 Tax=Caerostris extrusa TaxID=172846 RepID=A0AAV4REZ8_CAEEX|nr:hypothetical protein CEXT_768551 [Caerostris extrusa]
MTSHTTPNVVREPSERDILIRAIHSGRPSLVLSQGRLPLKHRFSFVFELLDRRLNKFKNNHIGKDALRHWSNKLEYDL